MKRILLYVIVTLTYGLTMQAQTQMEIPLMADLWKMMPDSLMPYLTHNDRLDMVDYLDAKMKAEVTNRLNGRSVMDSISDGYLHLTMNEVTEIEMAVLPVSEITKDSCNHVICVITTYGNPKLESKLSFYTAKWNDWQPIEEINIYNMFSVDNDCNLVTARFGKSTNELLIAMHPQMLQTDEKNIPNSQLYTRIIKWCGKTFKEY